MVSFNREQQLVITRIGNSLEQLDFSASVFTDRIMAAITDKGPALLDSWNATLDLQLEWREEQARAEPQKKELMLRLAQSLEARRRQAAAGGTGTA